MEGTDFLVDLGSLTVLVMKLMQACCVDGACFDLTAEDCDDLKNVVDMAIVGDDCDDTTLVCAPVDAGPCGDDETGTGVVIDEPVGACCKSDVCSEKTAAECAAERGLWGGAGTSCDDADICRRVVGSGTNTSGGGGCQSSGASAAPLWAFVALLGLVRRRRF